MQKTEQKIRLAARMRQSAEEVSRVGSLAGAGVLAALGIVIKSMTITFGQLFRFGFTYLSTALSGYLYGPLVAGLMGMVVDVLGFLLRPTGPYFFGFTLNAFISGCLYGIFLYRQPVKLFRCFLACASSMAVVSFLLNPLWLHIMYGDAWVALVVMRLVPNAIILPVNTMVLYGLLRVVERYKSYLPRR